jgi:long-chain acyl-CoA synthetase
VDSVLRLIDAFLHQVDSRPDAIALVTQSSNHSVQTFSWQQLSVAVADCAWEIAQRFASSPASPRCIGHASDNTCADVVIALASMSLGAIEVPIDHRLSPEEIWRRWERVGGLWLDRDDRRRLGSGLVNQGHSEHRVQLSTSSNNFDAPSLILWTSGTTGEPQGVTLSQRNLAGNALAKLEAVPQQPDDIRLCVLPISHAYARTCDLGTWLLSGCTLAMTLGYAGLRRLAPLIRPTLINTVPSLAARMLQEDSVSLGIDRLRLLGCGGAGISESSFRQWKERGVTVIQGYGLTETSPVICSATPGNASPGLVGGLVNGWESKICQGQLFVRGPHTMLGYWKDQDATNDKVDEEGWLATGDLVEQDARTGQLRILGRVDDVIVLDNGRKIFPSAIEMSVERLEPVRHALLVHRRDLQLWIDVDEDSDDQAIRTQIGQILHANSDCHGCSVHRFMPSLCEAAGELTVKGTIRRGQILENRFSQ